MTHPKEETTFVLIKPDGVRRGLTGEIIRRIEQVGLKVVALEMFVPTYEQIDNHYPKDAAWIERLGQKTTNTYEKFGLDLHGEMGTIDKMEIGTNVRKWLVEFMISAPLIRMIVKGPHAITMVRKLVGPTIPADADMGTIRGDFSVDSPAIANREKRPIFNLVHASETHEEAKHEIEHWFGRVDAVHDYERVNML